MNTQQRMLIQFNNWQRGLTIQCGQQIISPFFLLAIITRKLDETQIYGFIAIWSQLSLILHPLLFYSLNASILCQTTSFTSFECINLYICKFKKQSLLPVSRSIHLSTAGQLLRHSPALFKFSSSYIGTTQYHF